MTVAVMAVMIAVREPEAKTPVARSETARAYAQTGIDSDAARKLIDAGMLDNAEMMLRNALTSGFSDPQAYALLADIASRRIDLGGAVRYYRDAVNMNPDYVDKRSGVFIGKKINVAANEAIREFKARVAVNGDDAEAREGLKVAYYLKRMIAGSCQ
ncbi:MAG: hypothetical protein HZA20_10680 [Nitrospirae bacterium]|nr:hypothetical protein [Nitrospirota bacterium]